MAAKYFSEHFADVCAEIDFVWMRGRARYSYRCLVPFDANNLVNARSNRMRKKTYAGICIHQNGAIYFGRNFVKQELRHLVIGLREG